MEKGPIIQFTEFYLGAISPITSGTRADHMRPRKVTAITVRARKRPNWNLFDISPPPIIIMGSVPPTETSRTPVANLDWRQAEGGIS